MFGIMLSISPRKGNFLATNWALGKGFELRSVTQASVASRSDRAQLNGGGASAPAFVFPTFLLFLPRQENKTAAPAQGTAVASASSFNPRTVPDQSGAQLEPHTPDAQNSNRCRSGGLGRQLVFVRLSLNTVKRMNANPAPVYVGVDVAKATLQVHVQGRQSELPNRGPGHKQLCRQLKNLPGAHVICEATGGYEQDLVQALQQAQILVSVVNPAQVRAAAQAQGQRAKTDRIDARMLSDYGQRYQPQPTPPPSAVQRQLRALTRWLEQLIDAQAVAKTQAEHHQEDFVRAQHALLLAHYQEQIRAVEAQLKALQQQDPQLDRRVQTLDDIAGVGPRTALLVLAHLPELGQLNRGQVAALAGLAPWTRESGTLKGIRCIGGGRPGVRRALYMAALAASRSNPVLRGVYRQLIANGKVAKVALTAVMRRLLVYMNHQLKALAAQPEAINPAKA